MFKLRLAYDTWTVFTKVDVTGYLHILEQITGYSFPTDGVPFMENDDRVTLPGVAVKGFTVIRGMLL